MANIREVELTIPEKKYSSTSIVDPSMHRRKPKARYVSTGQDGECTTRVCKEEVEKYWKEN